MRQFNLTAFLVHYDPIIQLLILGYTAITLLYYMNMGHAINHSLYHSPSSPSPSPFSFLFSFSFSYFSYVNGYKQIYPPNKRLDISVNVTKPVHEKVNVIEMNSILINNKLIITVYTRCSGPLIIDFHSTKV